MGEWSGIVLVMFIFTGIFILFYCKMQNKSLLDFGNEIKELFKEKVIEGGVK